jgi:hypothetical protein
MRGPGNAWASLFSLVDLAVECRLVRQLKRHAEFVKVCPSAARSREETMANKDKVARRPECPACGSAHTQPFTHAGPGARVNMKCIDCGHLFRDRTTRR